MRPGGPRLHRGAELRGSASVADVEPRRIQHGRVARHSRTAKIVGADGVGAFVPDRLEDAVIPGRRRIGLQRRACRDLKSGWVENLTIRCHADTGDIRGRGGGVQDAQVCRPSVDDLWSTGIECGRKRQPIRIQHLAGGADPGGPRQTRTHPGHDEVRSVGCDIGITLVLHPCADQKSVAIENRPSCSDAVGKDVAGVAGLSFVLPAHEEFRAVESDGRPLQASEA